MPVKLEIPVFSPSSALHAQALGAQRIELNARGSYAAGGTTPAPADLEGVTKWLGVPVRVMIRPRGKPDDDDDGEGEGALDFVYSDDEFAKMVEDVAAFRAVLRRERGDGFVFGILTADGAVDAHRNGRLVEAAGGLACSFHRAFDEVVRRGGEAEIEDGVRVLVECGFKGVLTSGGPGDAAENKAALERIVRAAGGRLEVIVGGGVRSSNVAGVLDGLGDGVWAHSSCFTGRCEEGEVDDEEAMGILEVLAGR